MSIYHFNQLAIQKCQTENRYHLLVCIHKQSLTISQDEIPPKHKVSAGSVDSSYSPIHFDISIALATVAEMANILNPIHIRFILVITTSRVDPQLLEDVNFIDKQYLD